MKVWNTIRFWTGGRKAAMTSVALFFLASALFSGFQSQMGKAGEPASMDRARKALIIEWIGNKLNEIYVFPEVAAKAAATLRDKLGSGVYDSIADLPAFARVLTTDLMGVAHDKHMGVRYATESSFRDKKENAEEERRRLELELYNWRLDNFLFKKIEHLEGNVGYLRFDEFIDARYAGDTAVAAMNFLGNCEAVIFDLRANGGGNGSLVLLLLSYLFDDAVNVCDVEYRQEGKTVQGWTPAYVLGPRLDKADVYVLTSRRTFSAAEEFTYDLQSRKRATVVGETTGGGGHTVTRVWNADLKIEFAVPNGRAVNPVTGTNWEGKGVAPDVACPADQALDKAYALALSRLYDRTPDSGNKKAWLKSLLDYQRGIAEPKEISPAGMEAYAGTYGPFRIVIESGRLWAIDPRGTKTALIFQGADTFILEGNKTTKIVFERDASGRVASVFSLGFDGSKGSSIPKDRRP